MYNNYYRRNDCILTYDNHYQQIVKGWGLGGALQRDEFLLSVGSNPITLDTKDQSSTATYAIKHNPWRVTKHYQKLYIPELFACVFIVRVCVGIECSREHVHCMQSRFMCKSLAILSSSVSSLAVVDCSFCLFCYQLDILDCWCAPCLPASSLCLHKGVLKGVSRHNFRFVGL